MLTGECDGYKDVTKTGTRERARETGIIKKWINKTDHWKLS